MAHHDALKVATAQYPLDQFTSLDEWRDKVARWVADGAATGSELLVFPEYAALEQATPYGPEVNSDLKATLEVVSEAAGSRVAHYVELARMHGVHILAGSGPVLRNDGHYGNAAQLVTPAGLVGEQQKVIMTPFERDWGVQGGGNLKVFETSLGRIGIAICYDSEFPVQVRALAEAGAELLLVPSCTEFLSGYHRIRTGARARALENQFACVTSPIVGDALWSPAVERNTGAAGVFVPSEHGVSDDGVLAEGGMNAPGWVTATIDLAALRALRFGGEMRNFLDWTMQAGADEDPSAAEIVNLVSG